MQVTIVTESSSPVSVDVNPSANTDNLIKMIAYKTGTDKSDYLLIHSGWPIYYGDPVAVMSVSGLQDGMVLRWCRKMVMRVQMKGQNKCMSIEVWSDATVFAFKKIIQHTAVITKKDKDFLIVKPEHVQLKYKGNVLADDEKMLRHCGLKLAPAGFKETTGSTVTMSVRTTLLRRKSIARQSRGQEASSESEETTDSDSSDDSESSSDSDSSDDSDSSLDSDSSTDDEICADSNISPSAAMLGACALSITDQFSYMMSHTAQRPTNMVTSQPNQVSSILPLAAGQPSNLTRSKQKQVNLYMITAAPSVSPEVFISYQWDKQPEVEALYHILTQEGLTCWMDIKNMGGGDVMYGTIDEGVTGCKVFISCVTAKYAEADNCVDEATLSKHRNKPIIPILLEKITWPPIGDLAMIFSRLLYVDFSDQNVQKSWRGPQLKQLISQIRTHIQRAS